MEVLGNMYSVTRQRYLKPRLVLDVANVDYCCRGYGGWKGCDWNRAVGLQWMDLYQVVLGADVKLNQCGAG